jgi:hypothetical protein
MRAIIRSCFRWSGVARRSCSANRRAVFLPLVAKGRSTSRRDRKCGSLARDNGLTSRVRDTSMAGFAGARYAERPCSMPKRTAYVEWNARNAPKHARILGRVPTNGSCIPKSVKST